LDLERGPGYFVVDGRVAVPVAADPGAPAHKGGEGRRSPSTFVWAGEGPVELSIEQRYEPEKRLVEDRHEAADLVERIGSLLPQLSGPPEDRHVFSEAAFRVSPLARREPGIVQPLHQLPDPPQGVHHRPAARLGRMGC